MNRGCCNECGYKADYIIDNNNYADNEEDAVEQAENYGVNSWDAFSTDVEATVVKE